MSPMTDTKVTYGFWGLALGAGVAMIVGFVWGGWTTSGATQRMSEEAVLASRASICVAQFMKSPDRAKQIKEFQGTESYDRSNLIETGGWDKMPGQAEATWGVASACAEKIESALKTDDLTKQKQAKQG